ncbi:MAG: PHP domain-containing protein [Clostridia bacterium]|nr:PHP domain-containing protein [Clostridia bacterium]
MALFTYDLHVHSCLSPCGDDDMTPCNIAGMAFLAGVRIVALTDHNSCKNCKAFFAACEDYGVVPVPGCELTTSEEIHMVCLFEGLKQALDFDEAIQPYRMKLKNRVEIFGSQPIMEKDDEIVGEDPWFLPAATSLSLADAAELVRSMGGVAYPAHIDRESNGMLAILGMFPDEPSFDLCEVRDKENAEKLSGGRRVVVSSDAHRLTDFAVTLNHIELDCDPEAPADEIRHALIENLKGTKL